MTIKANVDLSQCSNPIYLLTLTKKERAQILEAQARQAASFYEADLALPIEERELTAFTVLDSEDLTESYTEKRQPHAA